MIAMQTTQIGDIYSVIVVVDGEPHIAASTHPNYNEIVSRASLGDETVVELFDVSKTVATKFQGLTERVSVANGRVYLDGDEMNSPLTRQIVRFLEQGEDFGPLANFLEKLMQNPNEHSREQLYTWLDAHDFTITPDGDILGYKGVAKDHNGNYVSINHGRAIVNGEEQRGAIRNNIGDVVEMPRSDVQFNPGVGCSTGLHVGTWDYASNFSQSDVLEVVVNPRDVVSVPTDCGGQKLRTCRYRVTGVTTGNYNTALKTPSVWDDEAYSDYDGDEWGDREYYGYEEDPWY